MFYVIPYDIASRQFSAACGRTKSNLSQKWTNMDVIYKACSKGFDTAQSRRTSEVQQGFSPLISEAK